MLGRGFRVYSWVTIVLLLVFGVWTSLYIPQLAAGEPTSGIGILERVNIYATMLWNAVLAFSLLRAHGAAAGEVGQAPKLRSAA